MDEAYISRYALDRVTATLELSLGDRRSRSKARSRSRVDLDDNGQLNPEIQSRGGVSTPLNDIFPKKNAFYVKDILDISTKPAPLYSLSPPEQATYLTPGNIINEVILFGCSVFFILQLAHTVRQLKNK